MRTATTTAQHAQMGCRLLMVEDVPIGGPEGVAIEHTRTTEIAEDITVTELTVWHATWMFSIQVEPEAEVTIAWEPAGIVGAEFDPPAPPDRTGQVRVHGTWRDRAEAPAWAPNGYPSPDPADAAIADFYRAQTRKFYQGGDR